MDFLKVRDEPIKGVRRFQLLQTLKLAIKVNKRTNYAPGWLLKSRMRW